MKFTVAAVDIDDDQLRRRYDEIGMDAIEKMRIAQADKSVMGILGEDWGRQQAATILGDLANNPGAGGVAAAGAGLGMGIGAGGVFGSMAQQIFSPMNPQPQQPIQPQPSGRFTQKPAVEEPKEDPVAALEKLKLMLDKGLIPQEKYDAKVQEILNRM